MIEMILSFWSFIRDTFLLKPWFTPLTLVIGGAWALLQFRTANKHERNNNELLNQPKFSFFDSMNCHSEIKRSCDTNEEVCRPMPDYCDNPECNKLHLFDIKNEGNYRLRNLCNLVYPLIPFLLKTIIRSRMVAIFVFIFLYNIVQTIQNIGIDVYINSMRVRLSL